MRSLVILSVAILSIARTGFAKGDSLVVNTRDGLRHVIPFDSIRQIIFMGVTSIHPEPSIPCDIQMAENYPNPFAQSTVLRFTLSTPSDVDVTMLDNLGRSVRTFRYQRLKIGAHDVLWDGTDVRGNPVPAGMYLCRLMINGKSSVHAVIIAK